MNRPKNRLHRGLIIGHYGGCNTGDEAMLSGLLGALDPGMRQDFAAVVKSKSARKHYPNLGITLLPASTPSVVRGLLNSNSLILGGGTHFHDDYTTIRYVRHFRYMLRLVSLSMLAKLFGRKVLWLGLGFGPFYRRPTRWVTRLGLKFCDFVTVRDKQSLQEISGWLPSERLEVTFDLAALLANAARGRVKIARGTQHRGKVLGISVTPVSKYLTCGPRVNTHFWNRFASALNQLIEQNPDLRVKVMVLRGGSREDDQSLSAEIYGAIARSHPDACDLVPYDPEPAVTLQRIAECDAFIATRFHAGILAYLAGCRLLFLEYHRKVRDLAREIRLSDDACINLSEDVSEEVVVGKLCSLVEGHHAFRALLPVRMAFDRALLNITAIVNLLAFPAAEPSAVEVGTTAAPGQSDTPEGARAPEYSHSRFRYPAD